MRYLKSAVLIMVAAWMAGCATSTEPEKVLVDKDNDPRVGEKVSQVCFTRSILGWSDVDNDKKALIVTMNDKRAYKVSVAGACDPNLARLNIAIVSRGSSNCFGTGDRIATDAQVVRGAVCTITRVNKWDPEALTDSNAEQNPDDEDAGGN